MRVLYLDWDPTTRGYTAVTDRGARIPLKGTTEPEADAEATLLEADELVYDEP
jgi:hypothetical protein